MSNLKEAIRSPLSFYERQIIETRFRGKWKVGKISKYLKRDHSIVSRELKRNRHPSGKYLAVYAQEKTDKRSHKTNKKILDKNFMLHLFVRDKLAEGWSPEQVAGRSKNAPPLWLEGKTISHETIYQYIYTSPHGNYLYHYLRKKNAPKRQKQHARKVKIEPISERISIHERPKLINERKRFGDWESDSALFRKQRGIISMQRERKSMLVRIHKLNDKSAEETLNALTRTAESLPSDELLKSITFDNGGEGARHAKIRDDYKIETYFCDPYKSWQKGGVENTIGLIREYLPRKTNLDTINEQMIYDIQERLNNRPRKKLGYLTPNEVIKNYLQKPKNGASNP